MRGQIDSEAMADKIVDMINRRPRSPTRDEIVQEIEAEWGVPRTRDGSRPLPGPHKTAEPPTSDKP